jgi:hypothetical protein
MEKNTKIAQIYGYLICLVAVITFLIAVTNLFNAGINLQDPLHAEGFYTGSGNLYSFEEYRLEKIRTYQMSGDSLLRNSLPDAKALRQMFEDQRNNQLQLVKLKNWRAVVTHGVLLLVAIILFVIHWRWLRKMGRG